MSYWTHLWGQHLFSHEFVTLRCADVLKHLWSLFVNMSIVKGILLNLFLLTYQLCNVDTSCFCVFLDKIYQFLQVIVQIRGTVDCLKKLLFP